MDKKLIYKWTMAILAVIAIILIFLDFASVININTASDKWFWVNNLILIIFAIDYFWHLHLASDKKLYFKTHIFDLLAIIPVGLAFNWMQLAKLGDIGLYFRLLRLIRLAGLIGKLREILHTNGLLYVIYFSIAFLMVGSVAISITEHVSLDRAFWWAITTASTVGYSDISTVTLTPTTLTGKFVVLVMILVGVGVMGMVTSSLTAYLMRKNAGKSGIKKESDLQLILNKLDDLEKQNQALTEKTQELQAEIKNLEEKQATSKWPSIQNWLKKKE